MDKEKTNEILIDIFKLPKNSKFIFYRNPRDCCNFKYEKINPDHIGIIYGLPKKCIRKFKLVGYSKIAKVFINDNGFMHLDKIIYLLLFCLSLYLPITIFCNLLIGICTYSLCYWLKQYSVIINKV